MTEQDREEAALMRRRFEAARFGMSLQEYDASNQQETKRINARMEEGVYKRTIDPDDSLPITCRRTWNLNHL